MRNLNEVDIQAVTGAGSNGGYNLQFIVESTITGTVCGAIGFIMSGNTNYVPVGAAVGAACSGALVVAVTLDNILSSLWNGSVCAGSYAPGYYHP